MPATLPRVIGAWVLGVAGLVWASVLNFSGSMRSASPVGRTSIQLRG